MIQGNSPRRLDLLHDVAEPRSISRQVKVLRRQISTVARGGPLAGVDLGGALPFTRPEQMVVSRGGGTPLAITLPADSLLLRAIGHIVRETFAEGEVLGRASGGHLGARTLAEMRILRNDTFGLKHTVQTDNYTMALDDMVVDMDLGAGNKTLTLPTNPGASYDGKMWIVCDPNSTWATTTNELTVARGTGDKINGAAADKTLTVPNTTALLIWHNAPRNWTLGRLTVI